MLSISGSGQHIQQKLALHTRLQHGIMNLAQMKIILQHMLSMVGSTEQEAATDAELVQLLIFSFSVELFNHLFYSIANIGELAKRSHCVKLLENILVRFSH